jgi:tocopherol O-methyltransferase
VIVAAGQPGGEAYVAGHYDSLDRYYRELWGEHVHHGLWRDGRASVDEATRALIGLVVRHAALRPGARVADAGCGYGGTARALAAQYGADVVGLTLSEAQAREARARGGGPRYEVRSWLDSGLEDASFDAVVAIESFAHMGDKPRAFAEAARVLRPGGRLVVVDWLAGDEPGRLQTRALLEPIAREGRLPSLASLPEYARFAAAAGLRVLAVDDLSRNVRRTWGIVALRLARRLVVDAEARRFLLSARNPDRAFALAIARIPLALTTGAMRLALLAAERPRAA